MKVLMLCNKSPWPAIEGGPMAMNSMVEGFTEAGHQVKVLAVNSDKYKVDVERIPQAYRQKTAIELEYIDLAIHPLQAFLNLFTGKSYHVERFISDAFSKRLISILQNGQYDVVQLETLFMAPYLPEIRKYSQSRVVLRAHNIEHLIWKRIARATRNPLKRLYLKHLSSSLQRYEMETINHFDGIVPITRKDAAFFKEHTTRPVLEIPYGVWPENFETKPVMNNFPDLYHIGAMNWMPNEEGIRWFLDKVWPIVHQKHPSLKCHLAGRYMPEWLKSGYRPNIEVVGEVPDAHAFIHDHAIAIVPLLSGSGIRIKIIESMALGKAVVTTSIGAEGINYTNGEHLLIADSPESFAAAVSRCVNNPDFCQKLGVSARKLIEAQYDNRKLIEQLTAFYQEIF